RRRASGSCPRLRQTGARSYRRLRAMSHRRVWGPAFALCLVLAAPCHAAVFRATVSGQQELSWKLDGTTGDCEIRHGIGHGDVKITFKSSKSALIAVAGGNVVGSINAIAKGSI